MSSDFHFPHQHGHHDEMAEVLPNTERFDAVANVFKQLSDPVRCRIFLLLCHSEECVINVAAFMEFAGLVQSRREGKEVFYRAADSELAQALHHMIEKVMHLSCAK